MSCIYSLIFSLCSCILIVMDTEIDPSDYTDDLREVLNSLLYYRMPFGMFGPKQYPPKGVLLVDLPLEYLSWFHNRSYPKGNLGELMMQVYELKAVGMDALFEPIRKHHGGRTILDPKKIKREKLKEEMRNLED